MNTIVVNLFGEPSVGKSTCAIDSAVALYLDIINLFLRLLGSSKDDD